MKCSVADLLILACHLFHYGALADVYMNYPRGSNNKMTEQSNNAANQNRLFNSQNNAAAGYQIGDNCVPNCKNGNNYDATKPGSQEGQMYFYHGEHLHIEWTAQHGCGAPALNTECQIVIQYMCNSWATTGRAGELPLRDGKDPESNNRRRTAGGGNNNQGNNAQTANLADADDPGRGRHETFESFNNCRKRQRNKGLYTAGRNLDKNIGAQATRQNNNNNRRGMECEEERDYYPYWHPSEWQDAAVMASDAGRRCTKYREESQNVKKKGYCQHSKLDLNSPDATLNENEQVPNNPGDCAKDGGTWAEVDSWKIDPPECIALPNNRDNHHGNIATGKAQSWMWKIPDHIPDNDVCVLRLRYNMSSGDMYKNPTKDDKDTDGEPFDYFWDLDSSFNDAGKRPIGNDPTDDFLGLGNSGPLQAQVNTAQFGRTFQDRSHTFKVKKRPDNVPDSVEIYHFGVRGRRGNIVQVYPAVEYDFVPEDLVVNQGDIIHFQWTGSDANNNNNNGNGKQGTDRSNLVQIESRATTKPVSIEKHTLFFDGKNNPEFDDHSTDNGYTQTCSGSFSASCGRSVSDGRKLAARFAFLDQHAHVAAAGNTCEDPNSDTRRRRRRNDQTDDNCHQLNAAPAYFDGGLVEMTVMGDHHIASTRNNDYSNRSQKATIKVRRRRFYWYEIVMVITLPLLSAWLLYQIAIASYAYHNPMSDLFSRKRRPMMLKLPCLRSMVARKEHQRRELKKKLQESWRQHCAGRADGAKAANGGRLGVGNASGDAGTSGKVQISASENADFALPPEGLDLQTKGQKKSCCASCCKILSSCFNCLSLYMFLPGASYFRIENLFTFGFIFGNICVAMIGMFRNLNGGFNGWFTLAKTGGYILDLNLSIILIPTLRTVQTGARQVRALDGIFNEDPILFHIQVAGMVVVGSILHVLGHIMHIIAITSAPVFYPPTTAKEELSGRTVWELLFDIYNRCAGFTGILILILMWCMFATALSHVRRRTFDFKKPAPKSLRDVIGWALLGWVAFLTFPIWLPISVVRCCRRRSCSIPMPESGKLGGFQVFWTFHKLWRPVFVLLLMHGPNQWIWFMWPLILVLCDRLVRWERRKVNVQLRSADLLKGKVMKVSFAPPQGFVYQAGMYVLLNCDAVNGEEWHPFTLTSAPEEGFVSCHIRCPDELDWCSALRRKLVESPANQISKGATSSAIKKNRIRVTYTPYTETVFNLATPGSSATEVDEGGFVRPWKVEVFEDDGRVNTFQADLAALKKQDNAAALFGGTTEDDFEAGGKMWPAKSLPDEKDEFNAERKRLNQSVISLHDIMNPVKPNDVIQMGIDGPHGAPSELVWRHRIVVLVGAGIGVTPFASILRSVTLRVPSQAEKNGFGRGKNLLRNAAKGSNEASEEQQWKPCEKIHFYWLCRSQEEFEWFYGLLSEAVSSAKKGNIEINLFKTGETELSTVKSLGQGFREFFGRPNWNRIFKQLSAAYPQENVGVFYCGPPAVRGDLGSNCVKATATNEHGVSFNLHAENF